MDGGGHVLQPASGASATAAAVRVKAATADKVPTGRKRKEKGCVEGKRQDVAIALRRKGLQCGEGLEVSGLVGPQKPSRKCSSSSGAPGDTADSSSSSSSSTATTKAKSIVVKGVQTDCWQPEVTAHTPRIKCKDVVGILRRHEQFWGGWGVYYRARETETACGRTDEGGDCPATVVAAPAADSIVSRAGEGAAGSVFEEVAAEAGWRPGEKEASSEESADDGEWMSICAKDFPRLCGVKRDSWKKACLVEHNGEWMAVDTWCSLKWLTGQ
jgi:hypothetical protein